MAIIVPYAISLGVSVAMSYAAGLLRGKEPDGSVTKDYKATPLVDRGSPIPWLVGRDVIGPVYTWAGDRNTEVDPAGGGKGTFGSDAEGQLIYYEDGWHALCVGPVRRLWNVKENDKVIFKGPIDSSSHPSGTVIDLGSRGKMRIFWGEQDQPTIDRLGDSDALGITSRWPYLCSIEWINKRLGTSPTWGRITYELEVWPYGSKLVATPPWFQATKSLTGDVEGLYSGGVDPVMDGAAGTNYFTIQSNSNDFKASQFVQLIGAGIDDGDYIIDHVEKFKTAGIKYRRIFLAQTVSGLTATGTAQAYQDNKDDGVNPAHTIDQALFQPFPHGRGLSTDDFDIGSLEDVGVICLQEGLRSTVLVTDFEKWNMVIAQIMQDIGCMLVPSPVDGRLTFRMIRENTDIAVLPEGVITGPAPEIGNTLIDEDLANRRRFTFRDREREYETTPIKIDDDGQAVAEQAFGQAAIDMPTVRDFTTGVVVAQRRNQEPYSNERWVRLRANREAPMLQPGQLFTAPGVDDVLLCMERERPDPDSGEVTIAALPNYYGIEPNTAEMTQGGGNAPEVEDTDEDVIDIPFEIPQLLNSEGVVLLGVGRIRAAESVTGSDTYVSQDDSTFEFVGKDIAIHTGGTLLTTVAADGPSVLDDGPTIQAEGPDIDTALDLSAAGKLTDWQSGRQVAFITDGTSYEIWFVRYLEPLGSGQYKLHGVLRHRHGTAKAAWAIGDYVVMMQRDQIKRFSDLLIVPDETLYVKVLPLGNGSASLDETDSIPADIYGEGVRPLPVTALRAGDPDGASSNSYKFPNDVTIRWGYRGAPGSNTACPATLPAGDQVLVRPPCDGTVRLRITDPHDGDAEIRVVDLPLDNTGEYLYPESEITSDFGLGSGYTPISSVLKLRSSTASPSPTNTGSIPLVVGGSPSGGNWTAFTPREMDHDTSTLTTATMSVSNLGARGMLFITPAGLVDIIGGPLGLFTLALKITAVTGGTSPSFSPITCWLCRFDSSNDLKEALPMDEDPGNLSPLNAAATILYTLTVSSWSTWSAGDRLGINVGFKDNGGGATDVTIELDSGDSYLENTDVLSDGVDFDVEASVINGGQQSSLSSISVINQGGTTS